ncbi:suppressor of fused domain protein [Pontibacter sp. G13]|uniref:suppressor of fused domain protein n=1 Tax=Pontibacter sp. G13 TaxID=3074898 RepID=UPI00288982B3|nr:suppressor of fused domain protein [Pontibacter sp. G13]WNJ21534.1 suppressor of fused domain protein [Pontibacter sp. G13]
MNTPSVIKFESGPILACKETFRVLEFSPNSTRDMWTYATCGMASLNDEKPIELHLFSSKQDRSIVELLAAVSYYHLSEVNFNLWDTMNFGRPWQDKSICLHGLISLPYLDGPKIENLMIAGKCIKSYWLIPISESEVKFKARFGVEALEELFDTRDFNYLDASRKSVVP